MLSRLTIQNYAIIDRLEVNFSRNLNAITGETGAGKSIILGALGLILGERAESNVLLDKNVKCVVEGSFSEEKLDTNVISFLKLHELDIHDELVVRREISPNGKSRAFINDTPVNLAQLNQLSSLLVDLHQQFDTLELSASSFQREVLDALAGNFSLLKKYRQTFESMQAAANNLQVLKEQKTQFNKDFDYHQFQFNELEEAAFNENELEDLEEELKLQTNAEGISNALEKVFQHLEESDEPVARQLKSMVNGLQPYIRFHPDIPPLLQRLNSAYIEVQDIADEAQQLSRKINTDPGRIEKINERISTGYRLLKKHGVKTTADLIRLREELHAKLKAVLNIDEAIAAAQTEYDQSLEETTSHAVKISEARKARMKPLENKVNSMLARVGMPNARLKVQVSPVDFTLSGCDMVEFLFDGNKSNQFQPLRKVASGGELSRLMLCIKSLVATSMDMPTLIFDEIDTGISGEAARQVAGIMKELSSARQVICITHQPQIAGKADAHYLVYKALRNESVTTGIGLLDTDERVVAIAKMLSGEKPTAAALENAKEMVMN